MTDPEPDPRRGLCEKVVKLGLAAKPEIALRSGPAGGVVSAADIQANDVADVAHMIRLGKRYLDAGAQMLMVESEGITEDVTSWRPVVFAWYVRLWRRGEPVYRPHPDLSPGVPAFWGRRRPAVGPRPDLGA